MIIKDILFKIKGDLKRLFVYPVPEWGTDGRIDYDKYWRKRRGESQHFQLSAWQRQRAELVLPFLSDGDVVVDIGGGDGSMLAFWQSQKNIRGVCVDNNQLILNQAKERGMETVKTDLSISENWEQIPACDFLTGFEILEHLPNPEEFILKVAVRVRKEMIFSFPNSGYYAHRLRLLFGRFPLQWVVHPGEHLRFWTVADARSWIRALGFRLVGLITYEGVPFANRCWPTLFGQGIIIRINRDDIHG